MLIWRNLLIYADACNGIIRDVPLFTVIIFNMEHDHTWRNLSIYADAALD